MALIVWIGCNNNFQDHFMGKSWFVVGGRKPLEYISMEKVWLIECLNLCTICASQNTICWIILLYSRLVFTNKKWPFARIINSIKLQALRKQISVFSKLIIAISFLNPYKYPWKSEVGIRWPRYAFVLNNFWITNKLELYIVPFDFCLDSSGG